MNSAYFASDYYTSYVLISLFHAEPAELADFALGGIPYTDYAVAGIRRLCRRLRHDGWRSGNSASRMAAL